MAIIEMSSDITVKLIRSCASDSAVVQAAQVSVYGENNPGTESERLINYLVANRHGSPFEHNMFTFYVEAPLFVFREWHRHRIASVNEWSGRYSKLLPKFYTPSEDRLLTNIGTSARPEMALGTDAQRTQLRVSDKYMAHVAWRQYELRLAEGISNELARTVLPLSVYSQMYWTVNARSLMNFLSLRVDSPDSSTRTRPQMEIQMGAEKMEKVFAELMPLTYKAFVDNGRIAP